MTVLYSLMKEDTKMKKLIHIIIGDLLYWDWVVVVTAQKANQKNKDLNLIGRYQKII